MEPLDPVNGAVRLRLTCEAARDPRPDLYRRIRSTDWTLLEFHQETLTLEDVFRELTKEG